MNEKNEDRLEIKVPKVGDKIYVDSSYYLSHGEDDFHGGIATVSKVSKGISAGKPVPYVMVEENLGTEYNWKELEKKQKELKKEFGSQKAHSCPDTRPEFNRWD